MANTRGERTLRTTKERSDADGRSEPSTEGGSHPAIHTFTQQSQHKTCPVCVCVCVTLEGLEALQRNSGGAGDELQQPGPALLVEGLHGLPEPLDAAALRRAVLEPRVRLPVVDVDFAEAAHDQLRGRRESERAVF